MNTHFLHTAGGFPYPYYLAVLSALKTQSGTVTVRTNNSGGKYLRLLQAAGLRIEPLPTFAFTETPPALVGKPDFWAHAHIKDYLIWVILAAHGGLCLDLDTFCLANCGDLLGDKQLMLPMDYATAEGSAHPYNSAIVAAQPGTLATELRNEAYRRLHRRPEDFPWGTTGPILVSEIARQHPEAVTTPPFRVCGGFGGTESIALWTAGTIPPEVRVIHLFAQHNRGLFQDVTPDSIVSGTHRLATAVRQVLTGNEIVPLPSWSVPDWLRARGYHYRAMFRYLRTHDCRSIMETGTNNGQNAIGMIRTSLAPESEIHYYGFDLFQPHDATTQALEMSTGYHNPPSPETVHRAIRAATDARVSLFAGNSRETLPKAVSEAVLPMMDFEYLDGGHSLETIASDFNYAIRRLKPDGIMFLDDYFPDLRHVGCALLVDSLDRSKYQVTVYPEEDCYPAPWGKLRTLLASVQLKG